MIDSKVLQTVLVRHHGGLDPADVAGLMRVWQALPAEVQQQYLAEYDSGDAPDVHSIRSETVVPIQPAK